MAPESYQRKLTAILSADVEGYSRLMGEDEDATIRTLTTYRELMSTLIDKHRGRVVDSPGDNLLAEFGSVVDAVRCAVEIQEELRVRNAELPESRKMEFRIGINLGDVVEEAERIYGDGINIAARVEGLADGGGICISGPVYDSIKNKLSLSYESMGEHTVKNIKEPVRVYRMLIGPEAAAPFMREEKKEPRRWKKTSLAAVVILVVVVGFWAIWNFYFRRPSVEPASIEKMAFPLPDKPSIAVLPFINMSDDPKQEYFSDGITEEIITALSKVPKLFVVARKSMFTYKGKPVKVQQVSEELGVRYVLEGSVRKFENRVRITVQLIDTIKGHQLWAERYERELKDIFAVQDEITMKILTALQVKLTEGESARLFTQGTENLEAYLKVLEGRKYFFRLNKENNARAQELFEQAIALDPKYAMAYATSSMTHMWDVFLGSSKSPKHSLAKAIELAQKAIAMDDSLAYAHLQLGWLLTINREHEKGIAEAERAVALDPNSAGAHWSLGRVLTFASRPGEAIPFFKKAIRLSPFPPSHYFMTQGFAYFFMDQYEKGIVECKKALQIQPNNVFAHIALAANYSKLGRAEEARAAAADVVRIQPKFSLDRYAKSLPVKNQADKERFIDALRKAGLPDKPPLPLPDKPSIAVLAFENMSGDPEQEYFSDGLSEEIITALSKTPKLFVIARNSSFTYKGKPVKVQQVGRELGVKYVLEGSVRKSGDRVRITAQLVDAKTGNHLWAERYDRDLKNIFAIQDEITMKIITALRVNLTEGEQAAFKIKSATNLDAYLKYLQAREYATDFNRDTNIKARKLAEEAIALDPNFQGGYSILAQVELFDVWLRLSKSRKESLMRAVKLAKKAISIEDSPEPHRTLAGIYLFLRKFDEAIAEGKKALELDPNSANAHATLGHVLNFSDRPQEAIPILKKAIRLNPYPPSRFFQNLAWAYNYCGKYEEAITPAKKVLNIQPDDIFAHIALLYAYSFLGKEEEARAQAAELIKINPKYCVRRGHGPFKNPAVSESYRNTLRKAGVPDCPVR